MPETVTVALVGDPIEAVGSRINRDEWEQPWDKRPKVTLEVEPDEVLASIIDRAFAALDVPPSPQGLASHHAVDVALYEEGRDRPRAWDLTLVDDDGRAIWTAYDLRLIPYSQLKRAVETGAIAGDQSRLYLVFKEAVGNGVGIDWPTIIHAWQAIDQVVARVGEYGGAGAALAGIYKLVRARLKNGREAVKPEVHRWSQRGAWPYTFARFLGDRDWYPVDLARFLGCSESQAQAVLELFGFAPSDPGDPWQPAGDEAARLLSLMFDEMAWSYIDPTAAEFEERISELLTTGERPPEPDYSNDDYSSWEQIERNEKIRRGFATAGLAAVGFLAGMFFRRDR